MLGSMGARGFVQIPQPQSSVHPRPPNRIFRQQFSTRPGPPKSTRYVKFDQNLPFDISRQSIVIKVLVGVGLGGVVYYISQ